VIVILDNGKVGIYVMFNQIKSDNLSYGYDTINFQIKGNLKSLLYKLRKSDITANLNNDNSEIKIKYIDSEDNRLSVGKIRYKNKSTKLIRMVEVELYGLKQAYQIPLDYIQTIIQSILTYGKSKPIIKKLDYDIDINNDYNKIKVLYNENQNNITNLDKSIITKFPVIYIYIPYSNSHNKKITNKRLINQIIKKYNLKDTVIKNGNYIKWSYKDYRFYDCDKDTILYKNQEEDRIDFYQKIVVKDNDTFEGIMKRLDYYGYSEKEKNISYSDFCYYDNVVIKIKSRDTKIINYDKSKRNVEQRKDKYYDFEDIKINRTEVSQKLNIVIDNTAADTITNIITEQLNQLKIMVFPSEKKKKLYEKDYVKDRPMKGYNNKEIVIDTEQVKIDTEVLIDLFNTDNINDRDYTFFTALEKRNKRRKKEKKKNKQRKSKQDKLFTKSLQKRFTSDTIKSKTKKYIVPVSKPIIMTKEEIEYFLSVDKIKNQNIIQQKFIDTTIKNYGVEYINQIRNY